MWKRQVLQNWNIMLNTVFIVPFLLRIGLNYMDLMHKAKTLDILEYIQKNSKLNVSRLL